MFRLRILILVLICFCSCKNTSKLLHLGIDEKTKVKDNYFYIQDIEIYGNKKTKEKIILRELLFRAGDEINYDEWERIRNLSRIGLLKKPLFNYVYIELEKIDKYNCIVKIDVEERWYLWPALIFSHTNRNLNEWFEEKDFSRLKYGMSLSKYNFRGANEISRIKFVGGYANEFGFDYRNIFLDTKRKHGLSLYTVISKQNQLPVKVKNNKVQMLKIENKKIYNLSKVLLAYYYRQNLDTKHSLSVKRVRYNVADTVISLNSDFSPFQETSFVSWNTTYEYTIDKRDDRYYPLRGHLLKFDASAYIFEDANKYNSFFITGKINLHHKISERLYLASGLDLKKIFSENPIFHTKRALGYNYNLSAYEYYVIDGYDFVLNKNILKYNLIKPNIFTIKRWYKKLPQFTKIHYAVYLSLFGNIAYVYDKKEEVQASRNKLANQWLYSLGMGLDLTTYYDNLLRIDYSINKQGEHGIFIHFTQRLN